MRITKTALILFTLTFLLSACGKKNAIFEVTNNSGTLLTNIEIVTDSGSSFEIERIESGSSEAVILDRNEVGAIEVFVNGKRSFSLNTEGRFGTLQIDAVPSKHKIEPGSGGNG